MSKDTCQSCKWWDECHSHQYYGSKPLGIGVCRNEKVDDKLGDGLVSAWHFWDYEEPQFKKDFGCIFHEPNPNKINKPTS